MIIKIIRENKKENKKENNKQNKKENNKQNKKPLEENEKSLMFIKVNQSILS